MDGCTRQNGLRKCDWPSSAIKQLRVLLLQSCCKQRRIPFDRCIPLGIPGGGAPFAKNQSAEVPSWNCTATPTAFAHCFVSLGIIGCASVAVVAELISGEGVRLHDGFQKLYETVYWPRDTGVIGRRLKRAPGEFSSIGREEILFR